MEKLIERLRRSRVLPVIEIDDAAAAAPLVNALADGGMAAAEFTLRTTAAAEALSAAKKARPDLLIGMGTVIDEEGAKRAIDAGADFLVTPGSPHELLLKLLTLRALVIPGVATASEAMRARAQGLKFLKFFPAEPAGGVAYLKALAGPLPDILFCPTGGVGPEEAPKYLALANVVCVGGSWVAPKAAIAAKDWRQIEASARRASSLVAKA